MLPTKLQSPLTAHALILLVASSRTSLEDLVSLSPMFLVYSADVYMEKDSLRLLVAMVIRGGDNTKVLQKLWSDKPKGFDAWVSML